MAMDGKGNYYFFDNGNNRVRKIAVGTGIITTVAGNGTAGYSGDGGPATQAELGSSVEDVAVDAAGDLFIADGSNRRVREVEASTGIITTVAGNGIHASSGDGGPATQASFVFVTGVAVDSVGNLFVIDDSLGGYLLRKVDAFTHIITTVAGNNTMVYGGDGVLATQTGLGLLDDVTVDGAGNLYLVESFNYNVVWRVDATTGVITTIAGNGTSGYSGDGGPARQAAFNQPLSVAVDPSGNLFVTDSYNQRVREVMAKTGFITTVAGTGAYGYSGNGVPATQAQLYDPGDVVVDAAGNVVFVENLNHVVRKIAGIASKAPVSSGFIPWHPHHTVRLSDGLTADVDVSDGHIDVTAADLRNPGRGPDLDLSHIWDSVRAQGGMTTTAGQGWLTSFTPSIGGALTRTVTYTSISGAIWPFTYTGSLGAGPPYTAYTTPSGLPWQLATSSADYTLTNYLTGATQTFDARGRYTTLVDAYGNRDSLSYGVNGPTSETNSGGRAVSLTYANGLLSEAGSPLWQSLGSGAAGSQHVTYAYSGTQLTARTLGAGTNNAVTTTFGYSGTQLTAITTPSNHTWTLHYDLYGRIGRMTSPVSGTAGQAGYTPSYTTAFLYSPGSVQVVQGYGSSAPLTTTYTLDNQGQAVAVRDGLGGTTRFAFDADHDITSANDALGNTTTYSYTYVGPNNSMGLLTQRVQPPVHAYSALNSTLTPLTTTYAYSPTSDDLTEVDLPAGGRTVYGYDGHHGVTSVMDALGPGSSGCTTLAHTSVARSRVTVAHPGRKRSGGQRSSGNRSVPTTATVARAASCGASTTTWRGRIVAYDAHGQRVTALDPRGVTVPPTTGSSAPTAQPNAAALSYTSAYTYSAQGDLVAASSAPLTTTAGANTPVTTSDTPDADGNVVAVTSPNGNTTAYAYDHLGRPVATTLPPVPLFDGSVRSPVARVSYDGDGNLSQTIDPVGDMTTRSYDPLGRLVSLTNPVSGTTLLTYTATELTATRDPATNVTAYAYDAAGRRTGTTDPLGTTTQATLDAYGNSTAVTTPLTYGSALPATVAQRVYDALNRVAASGVGGSGEVTPTLPQTTTTNYDPDGNVAQVGDPNGNLSVYAYDLADQAAGVTIYPANAGAPIASQSLTLDPAGEVTGALDFNDRFHGTAYDGAGRATLRQDCWQACPATGPAPLATSPIYDPDGNVVGLTRQENGATTAQSAMVYNAAGWLTSQADRADGSDGTSYGYDAAGQLRTQSLLGGTAGMTSTLDAAGRATELDDNAAGSVTTSLFGYTPNDQPYTATLGAGAANVQEQRQYDGDNRLTQLTWSVAAAGSSPLTTTYAYSYTPQGRTAVSVRTDNLGSGGAFQDTPDAHGRLYQDVPSDVSIGSRFLYDGNDNLTEIDQSTNLNVTAKPVITYAYSNTDGSEPLNWLPNELLSVTHNGDFPAGNQGTTSYAYDNVGNTTAITYPSGSPDMLTYNAAARLVAIQRGDGTGLSIGYNARGLRASYTITRTGQTAPLFAETFTYRRDQVGQVVVTGTTLTATLTQTYLYRPDGTPLELLQQTGSGAPQRYWYVVDGKGNVTGLIDGASGQLVCQYGYDAWGKPVLGARDEEGHNVHQPLRYRGYWYDGWGTDITGTWDSGPWRWYGLQARSYDPDLKRFLQPDPSSQDGVRSYVYCHDAPLDCADPSGLAGGEGGGEPGAGPEPGGVLSPEAQAQADVQILRGTSDIGTDPAAMLANAGTGQQNALEPQYATPGGNFTLRLSGGWQDQLRTTVEESDQIVYKLSAVDAESGAEIRVLKGGKTEGGRGLETILGRFGPYARAGRRLGLTLQIEGWRISLPEGITLQNVEDEFRTQLEGAGNSLPWDNSLVDNDRVRGGRLGRPGPGVPFVYLKSQARRGNVWDEDEASPYYGMYLSSYGIPWRQAPDYFPRPYDR